MSEDNPLSVAPSEAKNSAASVLSSSFSSDSTCHSVSRHYEHKESTPPLLDKRMLATMHW